MYRKSVERIESALLFYSFVQSFECTLNLLFFLPLVNITSVKLLYCNFEFLVILYKECQREGMFTSFALLSRKQIINKVK